MTWSVRWTVLPRPAAAGPGDHELHVSLVAAPVDRRGAGTLAGSPLLDWPALLADVLPDRLVSRDGAVDVPLRITTRPDPSAWGRFVDASTPVLAPADLEGGVAGGEAADVAEAATQLEALERLLVRTWPSGWPRLGDRQVLGVLGELVSTRRGGRVPINAVTRVAARARRAAAADFDALVAGVRYDPERAVALGLRVDAVAPAIPAGEHWVRVVGAGDRRIDGPQPVEQPWTLIGRPSAMTAGPPDVVVSSLAVEHVSRLVDDVAIALADAPPVAPLVLPAPPDCGFTVAMRHRASDGPELAPEDLVAGVRVDVTVDDGPPEPVGAGATVRWTGGGRPLRYGSCHRFTVRAVDLAGDAVPGTRRVLPAVRYLRRTPLDPPAVRGLGPDDVLRIELGSDAAGHPLGPCHEWQLSAPALGATTAAGHGVEAGSDPAAAGVSLIGLPGRTSPLVIPFPAGGGPLRLIARPAVEDHEVVAGPTGISVEHEPGSDVVELHVAPRATARFELATPVAGDLLCHLHVGDLAPSSLLDGTAIERCRRRPVTVVHEMDADRGDRHLVSGSGAR